jgi:hypothetical protein
MKTLTPAEFAAASDSRAAGGAGTASHHHP